jgi:hypothetical protein
MKIITDSKTIVIPEETMVKIVWSLYVLSLDIYNEKRSDFTEAKLFLVSLS